MIRDVAQLLIGFWEPLFQMPLSGCSGPLPYVHCGISPSGPRVEERQHEHHRHQDSEQHRLLQGSHPKTCQTQIVGWLSGCNTTVVTNSVKFNKRALSSHKTKTQLCGHKHRTNVQRSEGGASIMLQYWIIAQCGWNQVRSSNFFNN